MKMHMILGVLLIVIGAFLLGYEGIEYTEREQVADFGPFEITTTEKERIYVPPLASAAVLVAGVLVLVLGGGRRVVS